MQKTEKHCKNQCFCYHKTTKISPKTGPKTQKSASGPGTCGTAKKDVANQKIEVKKLKNTVFFHFSLAGFGRARSRTGVFRTFFYSVFWRRASRPIKNRRFWPKNAPPPGKPVTFYECHPEDHAPAPSVRADFVGYYGYHLFSWCQIRVKASFPGCVMLGRHWCYDPVAWAISRCFKYPPTNLSRSELEAMAHWVHWFTKNCDFPVPFANCKRLPEGRSYRWPIKKNREATVARLSLILTMMEPSKQWIDSRSCNLRYFWTHHWSFLESAV